MTRLLEVGDRVTVTCPGEPRFGQTGTVTSSVYPARLTGRPMVDVLFDGERGGVDDEGVYVQNLEVRPLVVAW